MIIIDNDFENILRSKPLNKTFESFTYKIFDRTRFATLWVCSNMINFVLIVLIIFDLLEPKLVFVPVILTIIAVCVIVSSFNKSILSLLIKQFEFWYLTFLNIYIAILLFIYYNDFTSFSSIYLFTVLQYTLLLDARPGPSLIGLKFYQSSIHLFSVLSLIIISTFLANIGFYNKKTKSFSFNIFEITYINAIVSSLFTFLIFQIKNSIKSYKKQFQLIVPQYHVTHMKGDILM